MANSEESGGITEQLSSYLAMVAGLRRATREKANGMAHDLLAQAGLDEVAADAQQRVGRLTEEIIAAGKANRSMVQSLIRAEVDKAIDRALGTLHFARAEDVAGLRSKLDDLSERVDQLDLEQSGGAGWSTSDPAGSRDAGPDAGPEVATAAAREAAGRLGGGPAAKKPSAKKAAAKKAPAETVAAKRAAAKRAAATKAAATRAGTTKAGTTRAGTGPTRVGTPSTDTGAAKRRPGTVTRKSGL